MMRTRKVTVKANCQICHKPAEFVKSLNTGWHVYVCQAHIDGIKKEDA